MTKISFAKFYQLKEQYEQAVNFEHRKLLGITLQPSGVLNNPLETRLTLDKLQVLKETVGEKIIQKYTAMQVELDLRRSEIIEGASSGNITEDISIALYALHPQYATITLKILSLVSYLYEYRGQDIAIVHQYRQVENIDFLGANDFIHLQRGKILTLPRVRKNPITQFFEQRDEIDPDELRPNITLSIFGPTSEEFLATTQNGKMESNYLHQTNSINIDPRIFPHLRYAHNSITAGISGLFIPYVTAHPSKTVNQEQEHTDPYFLSTVEIVAGRDVKNIMAHYLGKNSPSSKFLQH